MLKSFTVKNYRCFDEFTIQNLERVNLLVGRNNSGKTALLEAFHLLMAEGDLEVLWSILARRGELFAEGNRQTPEIELDISHLFWGRKLDFGQRFHISSESEGGVRWLEGSVTSNEDHEDLFRNGSPEGQPSLTDGPLSTLTMMMVGEPKPDSRKLPLTIRGGLPTRGPRYYSQGSRFPKKEFTPHEFITTDLKSTRFLIDAWQEIALTDEEGAIVRALQVLDSGVERIAVVARPDVGRPEQVRTGVIVKLASSQRPVPLGSMGEGMWRMLVIAMALVRSAGGVLLIDEIDTGLHHSAMAKMWRLIAETSRRLNVQVFATTHSYDCLTSLASVIESGEFSDWARVHRIEKERKQSVSYTEEEIAIAAKRGTEMR